MSVVIPVSLLGKTTVQICGLLACWVGGTRSYSGVHKPGKYWFCCIAMVWHAGSSSGQSRMQQLLQLVTSFGPLDKPQLGRDAPPEVRRMLQVR